MFLRFRIISWLLLTAPLVSFSQTAHKTIAVTMDDLPLNIAAHVSNGEMRTIVERLLVQITREDVPVVAFVNENKLELNGVRDPERVAILKLWLEAGVDLGNHTYAHKSENRISLVEAKEDILGGERTIKELCAEKQKKVKYFRHPFLHTGRDTTMRNGIARFLDSLGYTIAPVTIDNAEWIFSAAFDNAYAKNDSAQMMMLGNEYLLYMKLKLRYFGQMSDSLFGRQIAQILLIHSNRLNSYYFSSLCAMIRGEGYSFVSLGEALHDEVYRSRDTYFGGGGISWLDRWALTQGKRGKFFADEPRVPKEIMDLAGVESE